MQVNMCCNCCSGGKYHFYNSGQAYFLSIIQMLIGVFVIIFWSASKVVEDNEQEDYLETHSDWNAGLIVGPFMILSSVIGFTSAKYKTKVSVRFFLGLMCVTAFFVNMFNLTFSSVAVLTENNKTALIIHSTYNPLKNNCTLVNVEEPDSDWSYHNQNVTSNITGPRHYSDLPDICKKNKPLAVLYGACLLLSIAYIPVAIWGIVLCCCAFCCGANRTPPTNVEMRPVVNQTQPQSNVHPPPEQQSQAPPAAYPSGALATAPPMPDPAPRPAYPHPAYNPDYPPPAYSPPQSMIGDKPTEQAPSAPAISGGALGDSALPSYQEQPSQLPEKVPL